MQKKSLYSHILSYGRGGAVQEALPILFTPVGSDAQDNPYTDLSIALGTKSKEKDLKMEVDTESLSKAEGLMGEQRAVVYKIQDLQNKINTRVMEDKTWLKSNDGVRMVEELQNLMITAPNDLKRGKEIAVEGIARMSKNESGAELMTDADTGHLIVRDTSNNNKITRVTPFEFYSGKGKYRAMTNNQAREEIEKGMDSPWESSGGISMKTSLGSVKGEKVRQEEIDAQLEKVGDDSESLSQSAYALLSDSGEVGKYLVNSGFDYNRLMEISTSSETKKNIEKLNKSVSRMIDSEQGLSPETKNGLRNAAMQRVIHSLSDPASGMKMDDPQVFNQMVNNQMKAILVDLIKERSKRSVSSKTDYKITGEQAKPSVLTEPIEFQIDDVQGLHAIPMKDDSYKDKDGYSTPELKGISSYIDYSGIRIGDGKSEVPAKAAQEIVNNMRISTAHISYLPYLETVDSTGKKVLKLATNAYRGDSPEQKKQSQQQFIRIQADYLKQINQAKGSGEKEKVKTLGAEMKKKLKEFVQEGAVMRTAIVYNGYLGGQTKWGRQDNIDYAEDNNAASDVSDVAGVYKSMGISREDVDQVVKTQAIVPLVKEVDFDSFILNHSSMRPSANRQGGKIKVMNVGGKLISFNDLKNL